MNAPVMRLLRLARVSEAFRYQYNIPKEVMRSIAAFVGDDDSGFSPTECSYDPIDVAADIIVCNGGADGIGPPGTGKSTLLQKVDHLWRKF